MPKTTFAVRRALLACALAASLGLASAAQAAADVIYDPDKPSAVLAPRDYPIIIDKLIGRGDYALAEKFLRIGIADNPLSVQMRFQRCVLLERTGRVNEAREALEAFVARYPEIPEPYNNLAAIYSKQGNLDRAEELLRRALALKPDFAMAHANLGNLYLARAKNAYATALSLQPGNARVSQKLNSVNALLR